MNMNPMQMFGMLMNSGNPMAMMENMYGNNPLFQRAKEMVKGKDQNAQMELLNKLCKQRGIDLNQLKGMFGIH